MSFSNQEAFASASCICVELSEEQIAQNKINRLEMLQIIIARNFKGKHPIEIRELIPEMIKYGVMGIISLSSDKTILITFDKHQIEGDLEVVARKSKSGNISIERD